MEDPQFKQGFKKYVDSVRRNCYMFEVSKCCGYSEIVPLFKNATCSDLHRNIVCQFGIKAEEKIRIRATATDMSGNVLVINNLYIQNDDKPIRNLILENNNIFKPVYDLPTRVVYKIRYETENTASCCCNDSSCNSNS